MRVAIISFRSPLTIYLCNRIIAEQNVVGIVFRKPRTIVQSLKFLRKRTVRLGWRKVADEVLLRLWIGLYHRWHSNFLRMLLQNAGEKTFPPALHATDIPVIDVDDLNSSQTAETLQSWRPDVIAVCSKDLLKPVITRIPPRGMLGLHPGITPEYRGVHAPFWTLYSGETGKVGFTVYGIDEGIDTGAAYYQGTINVDLETDTHITAGIKALFYGTESLIRALEDIEFERLRPMETCGRRAGYFTHPGFSDYLIMRRRLKELRMAGPRLDSQLS